MYVILFALLVLGACVLAVLAGRQRFRTLVTADVHTLLSNAAASVGPDQLRARFVSTFTIADASGPEID